MSIAVVEPSATRLRDLSAGLRSSPFTYDEVGATRQAKLPDGYRHDRVATTLGRGDQVWATSQDALRSWQAHLGAGADVFPHDAPLEEGTVVILTVRVGPLFVVAPCRIVYATEEVDRFGFAYGTLPGHPERGEEAFHVTRSAAGTIAFEIVAFSKPAALSTRLGRPVARAIQTRTTQSYVTGIRNYVSRH